ncbi:hypothetical protein [Lactovum odontotermitis]
MIDFENLFDISAEISFTDLEGNRWQGVVTDYTPSHDSDEGREEIDVKVIDNPTLFYIGNTDLLFYTDEISDVHVLNENSPIPLEM